MYSHIYQQDGSRTLSSKTTGSGYLWGIRAFASPGLVTGAAEVPAVLVAGIVARCFVSCSCLAVHGGADFAVADNDGDVTGG